MLHWGMAFLRVGRYDHYLSTGEWTASQGIWLEYCGPDTLHANKLGILLVPESAGNACGNGDNAACYSAE